MEAKKAAARPIPWLAVAEPLQADLEARRRAEHAALVAEGYGAAVVHEDNSAHSVDDQTAALAILKAIHATGGAALSNEEVVAFIKAPIYLGAPRRVPKPKAGPQSRDTQYDHAFSLRKRLFHKLERLPKLRAGAGKIDLECMARIAARLAGDGVPERDLLRWIFRETAGAILKPTSSGEQITMRELRKARALLSKRGRWPKLLG